MKSLRVVGSSPAQIMNESQRSDQKLELTPELYPKLNSKLYSSGLIPIPEFNPNYAAPPSAAGSKPERFSFGKPNLR